MTARTDRIDELLRQEISGLLSREVKDPRIGFATVTRVETTADLAHARVWVSVIGTPAERIETVRALEHAMPFVRHELGSRLRLRRIPNLHIRLDETAETGTRVLHLLEELERGNTPQTEAPLGETLPTPVIRRHQEGDAEPDPAEAEPAADLILPEPPINRAARRGRCRGNGSARPTNRTAGSRRPGR
jgi:ribosome-binding factor A